MSSRNRDAHMPTRLPVKLLWPWLLATIFCALSLLTLALSPSWAHADERATPSFAPIVKDNKATAANLALVVEIYDNPAEI